MLFLQFARNYTGAFLSKTPSARTTSFVLWALVARTTSNTITEGVSNYKLTDINQNGIRGIANLRVVVKENEISMVIKELI